MSFSIEFSIDPSIQICFVVVNAVNRQMTGMDKHMHILEKKCEADPVVACTPDLEPARIIEIELGQPLPIFSALDEKTGQYYRRAMCLVRLHSQPLGLVELQLEKSGVRADEYAPQIWQSFGAEINE